MERIEHRACFDGWQDVYRHESASLDCSMNFSVFLPPLASKKKLPVLYWLSGLTCGSTWRHHSRARHQPSRGASC
jgi:S-formylglutathione hydrolase